jgi:hypothetical protein
MEGFLESFLYLLITIVILVLSMRKKKPVQHETEETPQQGDPFSGLFGDEEDHEEYNAEPQPAAVSQEYDGDRERPSPWISKADASKSLLDAEQVLREAEENNPIAQYESAGHDDVYEIGYSVDNGIRFDLKKAVIYSEIIERRIF